MPTLTHHYLQAFRERRAYCQALVDLSEQQSELIDTEVYTDLVDLLNHKQQLLDLLLATGSNLWHDWKSDRNNLAQEDRDACNALLQETETLLQQLMLHEQQCTTHLSTRRDAVQTALRNVQQAGVALNGYAPSAEAQTFRRLDFGL